MKKYLFLISLLFWGCKSNYDYGKEELDKKNYAQAEKLFNFVKATDSDYNLALNGLGEIYSYYDSLTMSLVVKQISLKQLRRAYELISENPKGFDKNKFDSLRAKVQSLLVDQLVKERLWQEAFEVATAREFNQNKNQKHFEMIRKNCLIELDAAGQWEKILKLFGNDINQLPLNEATIVKKATLHKPIFSLPYEYQGRFRGDCQGGGGWGMPAVSFVFDIVGGQIKVSESSSRGDYETYECSYSLISGSTLGSGGLVATCGQNDIRLRYNFAGGKVEWFVLSGYCAGEGDIQLYDVREVFLDENNSEDVDNE